MTGYAQVFHRQLVTVDRSLRSLLALAVTAGTVVGNLLLLSLVSKLAVVALAGAGYALAAPVVTACAVALAARVHDVTNDRLSTVGLGWLFAPLLLPLYSLAGIKGTVEYCCSWDGGWYHAAKGV
jgi:threonine/homoserine efflux transporter RhtA